MSWRRQQLELKKRVEKMTKNDKNVTTGEVKSYFAYWREKLGL